MDYYCSEKAIPLFKRMSHLFFYHLIEDPSVPEGLILITDEFISVILLTKSDFLPTSDLIVYYDIERYKTVDFIENGSIPEELDPVPGTRIYKVRATFSETGSDEWEFTLANIT